MKKTDTLKTSIFQKFIFFGSVFGERQLMQISFSFKKAWERNYTAFYYFNFERSCDVLEWKMSYFLLSKKVNFNKTETKS